MGRVGYAGTLVERMERKRIVDPVTGCWNWHGARDTKGYGQIRIAGKNRIATQISLELSGYPRTAGRPCALHKCDNPACVNPDHLWWGTHQENISDAKAKGRMDISGLEIGRELSAARKQPLPIVNCQNCGLEFVTSKARFLANKRHYCSTDCCRKWQSENFTGRPRGAPCSGTLKVAA